MAGQSEIRSVLAACLSSEASSREHALKWLESASQSNLPQFLAALASELADVAAPPEVRSQAGLYLKNQLTSKNAVQQERKFAQWRSFDEALRTHIKNLALTCLGTEQFKPSIAAQLVSRIAQAELAYALWEDCIPQLIQRVVGQGATEQQIAASLEALGYICEEVDSDSLMQKASLILNAVVTHMYNKEGNRYIRLVATKAFCHALEFCSANFAVDAERNQLMLVICETTQADDKDIRVAAMQCLVKTMELYYKYMEPYMRDLFGITLGAMRLKQNKEIVDDIDDVVLQGIEFWSSVCDKEYELIELLKDYGDSYVNDPDYEPCLHYARGAAEHVVPILLELLVTDEDEDSGDDWGPTKAASVCLDALAQVCRGKVQELVLPFVHTNLKVEGTTWQQRDAGLMALAAVLWRDDDDVAGQEQLLLLARQAIHPVVALMQDPSPTVRDSVAFVIGKIGEHAPESILLDTPTLDAVAACMKAALKMEARVAANACWTVNVLAKSSALLANPDDAVDRAPTFHLSGHFGHFVQLLFETADREDASQHNLQTAAYDALGTLVEHVPRDCYTVAGQAVQEVMRRMQATLQQAQRVVAANGAGSSQEHVMALANLHSMLLAALVVSMRGLDPADVASAGKHIMELITGTLAIARGPLSSVKEDALMAIDPMADALGPGFVEFTEAVLPFVLEGLRNVEEEEPCFLCVGLVGDIARAIGSKMLPYCDVLMQSLFENVENPYLAQKVKPHIFSGFADVAMAIGTQFEKYCEKSCKYLEIAAKLSAASTAGADIDDIEYVNELRESCLEGYTGILQALKGDGPTAAPQVQMLAPMVPGILSFIEQIMQDKELTDSGVRASLGLVGDLCDVYGAHLAAYLKPAMVESLVQYGMSSDSAKTKQTATYALTEINKIKQQRQQGGGF